MEVVNRIDACCDDEHGPRKREWTGETVHRIKVPGHNDAAEIARFDRQLDVLGNKMAYTLVILPTGLVEQALPFDVIGWHARGYSRTHIGIGCVGDFTLEAMPNEQLESLMKVLWWCSTYRGGVVDVFGHTERPDASNYTGHDCPGVNVDMDAIRAAVAERCRQSPECPPNPGFTLTG